MAGFSVEDDPRKRFSDDFVLLPDDPHQALGDGERDYLDHLQKILTRLAGAAVAEITARLRVTLANARQAWRAGKVAELREAAQQFANGALEARAADERSAAIEADYLAKLPNVDLARPENKRFADELALVVTNFAVNAEEQAFFDRQNRLIEDFAKDEVADAGADYSDAALAARRHHRSDAMARIQKNFEFWKEGGASDLVTANVSMIRGRYSAQREQLRDTLFKVQLFPGKGADQGHYVNLGITVMSGLPPPDDKPSPAKQELLVAINKAETVITTVCHQIRSRATKTLFPKFDEEKRGQNLLVEYVGKLTGIATLGLEGQHPDLAKLALVGLQNEFLAREGVEILNRYVRRLGWWAFGFAGCFLFAYVLIQLGTCGAPATATSSRCVTPGLAWWDLHKTFLLAAAGAAIGSWASFSVRKVNLTFEQLATPEDDALDAPLRVVFVVVLTLAACLLFWNDAINVKIGNLNTEPFIFAKNGTVALLIGFFCGLSERALATAVAGRATGFVGGIAGVK